VLTLPETPLSGHPILAFGTLLCLVVAGVTGVDVFGEGLLLGQRMQAVLKAPGAPTLAFQSLWRYGIPVRDGAVAQNALLLGIS
jgi:hypothetical protein